MKMRLSSWVTWVRWQIPYIVFSIFYFPVTLMKRLVSARKRSYLGRDPLMRRWVDKWSLWPGRFAHASIQRPIWIHMHSGGEVMNAMGLLKRLCAGSDSFVLSTESYDTYSLLSKVYGKARVFFPPWDIQLPVCRVLDRVQPQMIVFIQNAYFPVLLKQAKKMGIKTILVNGLLSRNVEKGNPTMDRALNLGFYRYLDAISVQTEEDLLAFEALGVPTDRLAVTGDIATDLSFLRLGQGERLRMRNELGLDEIDPVLIVGSAHPGELSVMTQAFAMLRDRVPRVRFIVAPRWIHEAKMLAEAFVKFDFRVAMKTQVRFNAPSALPAYDVLILDTFGELRKIYGVADVAVIGSSFVPINERRGGHNPLEPLAHGVVPLFGPHMNLWLFAVEQLRSAWSDIQVETPETLADRAYQVLVRKAPLEAIRKAGAKLIEKSCGALERTTAFIRRHVDGA